jgi:hypothetical protein
MELQRAASVHVRLRRGGGLLWRTVVIGQRDMIHIDYGHT